MNVEQWREKWQADKERWKQISNIKKEKKGENIGHSIEQNREENFN